MGTLGVAPNGRIDVIWLDTRNAANNTDSQLFYSYSFDGGNTWAPNVQVSNSFNPFLGYPNQNKMGDYMTIVSDNTGGSVAYCATFNNEEDIYYVRVAPMSPVVQSAVSRKTHGAAGVFDIPLLPLSGSPAIECRTGAVPGAHQVVVTFANPVTVAGAAVTSGTGAAAFSVSGSTVTIDLTNVANAQTLTVTLNSVNDGVNFGNVAIPIGILAGDSTANRTVNTSDVGQIKAESGNPVTAANFRTDVATNGAITAGDISLVKANVGNSLP